MWVLNGHWYECPYSYSSSSISYYYSYFVYDVDNINKVEDMEYKVQMNNFMR